MSNPMATKTSTTAATTVSKAHVRSHVYEFVSSMAEHLLDAVGAKRAPEFHIYAKYASGGRWNFVMTPTRMELALTMAEKRMLKDRYHMVPTSRGKLDIFVVDDDENYKKRSDVRYRNEYNKIASRAYPASRDNAASVPADAPFTRASQSRSRSRSGGASTTHDDIPGSLLGATQGLSGGGDGGAAAVLWRIVRLILAPLLWLVKITGVQGVLRMLLTLVSIPVNYIIRPLLAKMPLAWRAVGGRLFAGKKRRTKKQRSNSNNDSGDDDDDDDDGDDDDDTASMSLDAVPTASDIRSRRHRKHQQQQHTGAGASMSIPPLIKWAIGRLGVGSAYGVLWFLFVLFQLASLAILLHVNPDRYACVLHHIFYWLL